MNIDRKTIKETFPNYSEWCSHCQHLPKNKFVYTYCMYRMYDVLLTMRKQIDIPDEHVPNLRIIAAMDNTNVKKWIENLVLSTLKSRVMKKKFYNKMIGKF